MRKTIKILLLSLIITTGLRGQSLYPDKKSAEFIFKTKGLTTARQEQREENSPFGKVKLYFAAANDSIYSPKKALIKSAIMPGWGHLYVHRPFKAAIYFSAEFYHLYKVFHYHDIYRYVKRTMDYYGKEEWLKLTKDEKKQAVIDYTGYNLKMSYGKPKEIRNKSLWWCGGIYIMCMLDAYVDAHLSGFPKGDLEFINEKETKAQGLRLSIPIGGGKK